MADTRANNSTHYVIGSGPAGVACAKALLAQSLRVATLDAGLQLEPETAEWVRQLAALQSCMEAGAKGIGRKRQFNSDVAQY